MDIKSGSGIRNFRELWNNFLGLKFLNSLILIREPEWKTFGSGIRDGKSSDPGCLSRIRNTGYLYHYPEHWMIYRGPEGGEKTILQSNNMVALRVSLLYLGMVWYDTIKDDIRDDIYQRSIKYVHIPTDQAFSSLYDLSPPTPPFRQQDVSLSRSSCVSSVELTERRGGGGAREKVWSTINYSVYAPKVVDAFTKLPTYSDKPLFTHAL